MDPSEKGGGGLDSTRCLWVDSPTHCSALQPKGSPSVFWAVVGGIPQKAAVEVSQGTCVHSDLFLSQVFFEVFILCPHIFCLELSLEPQLGVSVH